MDHYDIIIVGLGPVGLFAANVFGEKGWKVLAIEQHSERWKYPRAIGMDDEILRNLQTINLSSAVLPRTRTIKGLQLLRRDNEVFFTLSNPQDGDFEKGPYLFYQPEFERILEEGAKRFHNVKLLYNCQLESFNNVKNGVDVSCLDKNNPQFIQKFQGRFLIGCDGANSTVRNELGIKEKSLNYDGYILKIDAIANDVSKFNFNIDYAQKYCSTKRAWVRMIGRDLHCRWEFQFKGENPDPNALTEKSALRYIKEAGDDVENIEIINVAFYKYRSVVQEKWRDGNVLIAGDAAHLTAPYIGQGMCGGFRDIINLSWKLEGIINREFSRDILSTYQSERSPHMKHLIRIAISVGYLFKTRLYYILLFLKLIPFLKLNDGEFNPPVPKLGRGFFSKRKYSRGIFPQFKLKTSEGEVINSDDYLGHDWVLISSEAISDNDLRFCQRSGVKLMITDVQKDTQMKINNWLKEKNVKVVLLRPDKYIFSSGNQAQQVLNDYQKLKMNYR